MLKKDSKMNQAVALPAVKLVKLLTVEEEAEDSELVPNVKCIQLFAPIAELKRKFRSNLLAKNQYTAGIAINLCAAINISFDI
jgi:hypothetical protein